jgi:hypothetical protein
LSESQAQERLQSAWESIYIAEGSDWFWWYGDDHSSANDGDFDELFRQHLKNVYLYLEEPIPDILFKPVKLLGGRQRPDREPFYLMEPDIDGQTDNYFKWLDAGMYRFEKEGGAMHQVQLVLTHLYYGFSMEKLFLRLDFHPSVQSELADLSLRLRFFEPEAQEFEFQKNHDGWHVFKNQQQLLPTMVPVAYDRCFETAIPFALLAAQPKARVSVQVEVLRGENVIDSRPQSSPLMFEVPGDAYEADKWYV